LTQIFSFHCSACGKCCNSAPLSSVPELFRHERRFIGCLGIRRLARVRKGDELGSRAKQRRASEADVGAFDELAKDCWFRLPSDDILLATQAFDDPLLARCPALLDSGACSLHAEAKPLECSAVPFDSLVPDRLQHLVFEEREADATFSGAGCIARSPRKGYLPVVSSTRVIAGNARRALAARRRALADDKRHWGQAVFRLLEAELFARPARVAALPTQGYLVLSLAPVLMVLARRSARARARCVSYLEAQLELCQLTLAESATSGGITEESARRLQAFSKHYRALGASLGTSAIDVEAPFELSAVEAWLEPGSAPFDANTPGDRPADF
jgi:Fe-S-cluster containining protein